MFAEVRPTLRLAFPLIIGQLGQMLLGVVDTLLVARVGVLELAALTLGNVIFHVPFVFGMGMLTCVAVRTSNARGAGDAATARASCRHGLYLATGMGVLLFAAAWVLSYHLHIFGQPADVTERAPAFFRILMASLIPGLASIALKDHSDALNRPWPAFCIFLSGVVLNLILAWILIFGKFGAPQMGLEGAAWATLVARCAILVAMLVWMARPGPMREWVPYHWLRKPDFKELRHLIGLGFPASLQMLSEVGAFSAAALLVGHFGKSALAAHQVAITCAGSAFMVPLGLAMALTVRMGEARGAGQLGRLRSIALTGWGMAAGFTTLSALLFLTSGHFLASHFVHDPEVVSIAAGLLVIVGVFQLFDGLQVASAAMLRGLQDVRLPAAIGFLSYWVIGIPSGWALAQGAVPGASGVWWGLAIGLAAAAVFLGPRLWRLTEPARAKEI